MTRLLLRLATVAVVVVLLLCLVAMAYYVTDADCRNRGGHTEVVYGGRGGWNCSGAQR